MSKKVTKKTQKRSKKYHVLKLKGAPPKKGLLALKKAHGKKLGVTCLFCKTKLKHAEHGGRKAILCKKRGCFKLLRCAYRYDWEALSPAFKKAA
jgi:hypothetical protein